MEGKVFAITGAGSGIGKATAIRLAELGAKGIAISDLDIDGLQDTRSQCRCLVPESTKSNIRKAANIPRLSRLQRSMSVTHNKWTCGWIAL